uniref:Candidate secreted effector n=1 Tax=Meloidogyne incognita TaxID=6306 RepID=A0A914NG97_MELIC
MCFSSNFRATIYVVIGFSFCNYKLLNFVFYLHILKALCYFRSRFVKVVYYVFSKRLV